MSGGNLERLIANKSHELSWPLRIRLACDVAKGLKYIHSRGIMHRDLTSKVCTPNSSKLTLLSLPESSSRNHSSCTRHSCCHSSCSCLRERHRRRHNNNDDDNNQICRDSVLNIEAADDPCLLTVSCCYFLSSLLLPFHPQSLTSVWLVRNSTV